MHLKLKMARIFSRISVSVEPCAFKGLKWDSKETFSHTVPTTFTDFFIPTFTCRDYIMLRCCLGVSSKERWSFTAQYTCVHKVMRIMLIHEKKAPDCFDWTLRLGWDLLCSHTIHYQMSLVSKCNFSFDIGIYSNQK